MPKRKEPTNTRRKMLSIRIDPDLHRAVGKRAAAERRSVSNWIEIAIEEKLRAWEREHRCDEITIHDKDGEIETYLAKHGVSRPKTQTSPRQ